MTVLRRLDSVLEPTKQAVLDMKASLDKARITNQDQALRQAAGQAFYNTSKFTLRELKARASQRQLKADFEAYLDGFSPNVQDILDNFEFRNQIPRLSKADALGTLIEKFTSADIDLSPNGLDNHGMGTVFEELVRRFNEENNEEAGEHWTPRDAVKLMAKLILLPVADEIESGTYLLYDGACGTGGMLTVAEETLQQLAAEHGKQVATHLYGQEINAETYAICKADLLLKGEGDAADNIVGGPEHSTLANDAFPVAPIASCISFESIASWKRPTTRPLSTTGHGLARRRSRMTPNNMRNTDSLWPLLGRATVQSLGGLRGTRTTGKLKKTRPSPLGMTRVLRKRANMRRMRVFSTSTLRASPNSFRSPSSNWTAISNSIRRRGSDGDSGRKNLATIGRRAWRTRSSGTSRSLGMAFTRAVGQGRKPRPSSHATSSIR